MARTVRFSRSYFALYGLAAVGMAIADTLLGAQVAAQTGWGHAQGWMTEMACFDALVAFLCARTLFEPASSRTTTIVASGLALLSALLAAHNLHAYLVNRGLAHLQGGVVHAIACIAGVIVARATAHS